MGLNPIRGINVCVYSVLVLSCTGTGLATGSSPVQGVLMHVYNFIISNGNRPKSLIRQGKDEICGDKRAYFESVVNIRISRSR
jgi:hypothetical protein